MNGLSGQLDHKLHLFSLFFFHWLIGQFRLFLLYICMETRIQGMGAEKTC